MLPVPYMLRHAETRGKEKICPVLDSRHKHGRTIRHINVLDIYM